MSKIIFGLLILFSTSLSASECVFVIMHGKWGGAKSPYLKTLADKSRNICEVELREMPWSRNRNYDETYEVALKKLSTDIKEYRNRGFKKIIIGGQSFGANASIAYQAYIGNADAIVALAPGHSPYEMFQSGINREAIELAKKNISDNHPETIISFTDMNQGEKKPFSVRSDVLYSFFNPDGLGNMPRSASMIKLPTPFMWVIGTADPLYKSGSQYAFDKAPKHPLSEYIVVEANHATTPEVASDQVVTWIGKVIKN